MFPTARTELRIQMGDVAFLIDTTCSMSSTANAMASEFGDIVDELGMTISDGAYGYGTFDDYNYEGMGSGADLPFILQQQITTDQVPVQEQPLAKAEPPAIGPRRWE